MITIVSSSDIFFQNQVHDDGGYLKLIIKEDEVKNVPGPVERVLGTFHNEVWIKLSMILIFKRVGTCHPNVYDYRPMFLKERRGLLSVSVF